MKYYKRGKIIRSLIKTKTSNSISPFSFTPYKIFVKTKCQPFPKVQNKENGKPVKCDENCTNQRKQSDRKKKMKRKLTAKMMDDIGKYYKEEENLSAYNDDDSTDETREKKENK